MRRLWPAVEVAPHAPYAERLDRHPAPLDRVLLAAWGTFEPRLLSALQRRRLSRLVALAQAHEKDVASWPDHRLRRAADSLRDTLRRPQLAPDAVALAFALIREATHRHVGKRHYPVQLLAGAAMLKDTIAEMETGEGKTLTALLPAVTAALGGRPVHVVTVNDYLARRDAEHLRPVYQALGVTVGLVEHGQDRVRRMAAYACDVTYCANKELVFDYLRDRLSLGHRRSRSRLALDDLLEGNNDRGDRKLLLRGLHFAIVDEADSVLIDEARTPLILSGTERGAEGGLETCEAALDVARQLQAGQHFTVHRRERAVRLSPLGRDRITELGRSRAGIWRIRRAREEIVQQALSALHLFRRDSQYIVAGGKVQIVDESTGRVLPDRSWERGLHQLIEAKEGCAITERKRTLARITYQRFFRRYLHVCGMTGTAVEVAGELRAVYGLKVVRIPTNLPSRRIDAGEHLFADAESKWRAVVAIAQSKVREGRAVLVGTRSVEASEALSGLLTRAGLAPVVLNARQDKDEAEIVARAGQEGRVTVATNMAGRGTDIQPAREVIDRGGLHVVLTEFHEARRIDRQLFGRAGRQGEPGSFESIVAIDDELLQRFAGRWSLWLVARNARYGKDVPGWLLFLLRMRSQAAASRANARIRRQALAHDLALQRAIGFSGEAE